MPGNPSSADIPPLAAWGLTGPLEPLPGGARNRVLRAQGADGPVVLKSTRRSEAALRWLGPVHAAARRAGLVMPELLPSQSGCLSVDGWTAEPFLPGTPGDRGDISDRLAAFHRLTVDLPQRPGFATVAEVQAGASSGDARPAALPDTVRARLLPLLAPLAEAPLAVVHGDVTAANLIRQTDGRVALVDWDEARRDSVLFDTTEGHEAARTAYEVLLCWEIEPDRARELLAGLA